MRRLHSNPHIVRWNKGLSYSNKEPIHAELAQIWIQHNLAAWERTRGHGYVDGLVFGLHNKFCDEAVAVPGIDALFAGNARAGVRRSVDERQQHVGVHAVR